MTDRMMTSRNNRIISLVIQGVHYNGYNIIVIWGENLYILYIWSRIVQLYTERALIINEVMITKAINSSMIWMIPSFSLSFFLLLLSSYR